MEIKQVIEHTSGRLCIYGGLKSKVASQRVGLTYTLCTWKMLKFLLQILKEKEKEFATTTEARIALTPGLSP